MRNDRQDMRVCKICDVSRRKVDCIVPTTGLFSQMSRITINNDQPQTVSLNYGDDLYLADSSGNKVQVCVIDIADQSALLEYRVIKSQQESRHKSLGLKILSLFLTSTVTLRMEAQDRVSGKMNTTRIPSWGRAFNQ